MIYTYFSPYTYSFQISVGMSVHPLENPPSALDIQLEL